LSLVEDVRKQIESRLKELGPLVEEYQQLEKMAAGWIEEAREKIGAASGRSSAPTAKTGQTGQTGRRRGRPPGTTSKTRAPSKRPRGRATAGRRGGRPAGGANTRAAQALKLVQDRPGITIPDIAQAMGIKQNYLYRVLPRLEKDGLLARDGRGWKATRSGAATNPDGGSTSGS